MIPYEFHITVQDDKVTLPDWKITRFKNVTSRYETVREESILTWNQEFANDQQAIIFLSKNAEKLGSNAIRMKVERPYTSRNFVLYHEAHFKVKRFIGHPNKDLNFLLSSINTGNGANWCTVRVKDEFDFGVCTQKAKEYLRDLIIEQEFESVIVDTNSAIDRDWSIDLVPLDGAVK